MLQESLFVDSIYDALRGIVERAGGLKAVGLRLRPTKSADEAGRWLADCLNTSRPEKLDPEDVLHLLRIGREANYHGAKYWIDTECGYAPTPPVEPADEQAQLMREYIEAVKHQQQIANRLERLAVPVRAAA